MDSLLYDVKAALRRLPKTPWFTLAVVATLTIAIGANTLIFSIVDGVLLRPLPFGNAARMVAVVSSVSHGSRGVSYPDFVDWREQSRRLDGFAYYGLGPANLTGRGTPARLDVAIVSANWFSLLGVRAAVGRALSSVDDTPDGAKVIILSDALWRSRFGASPDIVNQTLDIDGDPYTVVGVAPPRFTYPNTPDIWIPDARPPEKMGPDARGLHFLNVIGRVAVGSTPDAAREEFATITGRLRRQYPQAEADVLYAITPLRDALVGDVRPALLVLFGAVGCVLLIACANVTNLLLVRATSRANEIALRIAIGADRRRIIQQLLTESVLLAAVGAVLGVLLAYVGLHVVVALKPGGLPRIEDVVLSGRALAFTATIATATGLLFGLAPALQASRIDLNETLKSAARSVSGNRRRGQIRGMLVIAETAVAVVLLVGAGLLSRSLWHMMDVNPGFRPEQVVLFDVSASSAKYLDWNRVRGFTHAINNRLAALPGTRATAYGLGVPFGSFSDFPVAIHIGGRAPESPDRQPVADVHAVSNDFFATLGIPVVQGRAFTDEDRSGGHRVVLINQTALHRFFPDGKAIGQHITILGKADTTGHGDSVQLGGDVVGIVGDVKMLDLTTPAPATVYQPAEQVSRGAATFIVRTTADPHTVIAAATRIVAGVDPDVPIFRPRTLATDVGESVARPRLYAVVVGAFAGVALLLTVIGIYSVLAYTVRERRRELGIRMALGARAAQVIGLVIRQGLTLTGIGLALGFAAAFLGSRVLASLLFGVSPDDTPTYAVVCVALLAVATLASWLPARIAATIDPLIAIRPE